MIETKEHLKKYTAPSNMKKYYQNHKEEFIKRVKEYKEKKKEYNKLASHIFYIIKNTNIE